MMKTVKVKDIVIGEGVPKICVPLIGSSLKQLIEEALFLQTLHMDVIEWRADYFEHVDEIEEVITAIKEIHSILPSKPLIFTFRSLKEGGEKEIHNDYYVALNKAIIETGLVDIIDVELFNDEDIVKELVDFAHSHKVYVILSNHDFKKTPSKEEIISRLVRAQDFGGDLPKIAVMPTCAADVLTLLDATCTMKEQFADRPIITMSMSGQGVISRLAGELFGSALTFGAAKKASAPGQIAVTELKNMINILHQNL
ncbi:type I 3-dehydroquinate dehydratase [Bacillus sp. FJAT-49705]|uniref:3-dehydroquinate dehydratase n=1 Tax=Cytobacillus citreus TaxID=2833586 RepID=A0ABS5NUD0_9BACI|nr:type I 3-dehydroquinate dehydratase [Cytobacillus citreus]MBS4191441.1 type I 3-dehydroquinate dehydratase [Cytobacillus citreus]